MPQLRPPSTGTVLGFIALMVALGGTALAATGQLVNIADGTTASRLAKVDSSGRLHVGDGSSAMTVDGAAPDALPSALVRSNASIVTGGCKAIITAPPTKALVLRDVRVATTSGASAGAFVGFYIGAPDCSTGTFVEFLTTPTNDTQSLAFGAGLAIPAGQALLISAGSPAYYLSAFGYSVPASAVPASATTTHAEEAPVPVPAPRR